MNYTEIGRFICASTDLMRQGCDGLILLLPVTAIELCQWLKEIILMQLALYQKYMNIE